MFNARMKGILFKNYINFKNSSHLLLNLDSRSTVFIDGSVNENQRLTHELNVTYILAVVFSLKNTRVLLLSSSGQLIRAYSGGFAGFKNQQNTSRQLVVRKILTLLKSMYLNDVVSSDTVSLHLYNVGDKKSSIVKLVSQFFLVTSIKLFNSIPYNGCKKKKLRRKKFSRQIRR